MGTRGTKYIVQEVFFTGLGVGMGLGNGNVKNIK